MQKRVGALVLLFISGLGFTGCSSEPKSAKALAHQLCLEFKRGSVEGLERYMSDAFLSAFELHKKEAQKYFKSKAYERIRKKVRCDQPTMVKKLQDGSQQIHFGSYFKVRVKEIQGRWQYIKR